MFSIRRWTGISKTIARNLCWSAQISNNSDILELKNSISGNQLRFPLIWLRDNCQCDKCFDSISKSRIIPLIKFDVDVKPNDCQVIEENGSDTFCIEWSDLHKSTFQMDWLLERSFDEENQSKWLSNYYRLKKTTWKASDYKKIISQFSYSSIMQRDDDLLDFLTNLDTYGVAVIENVGKSRENFEKFIKRIGHLKETSYGDYFVVEAKKDATNVAYLSDNLHLHLDLPYYEYGPGVNILYYFVQADMENEGANQLVDGLNVSNILKEQYPNEYRILTKTPVEWCDIVVEKGQLYYNIYRAPVICEDMFGQVTRILFNHPQRDSHFSVPPDVAVKWYKALKVFVNTLFDKENLVEVKMKQGNIFAFDNLRILHGRTGYSSDRCVYGAYMDWDIIRSKMRVLKSKNKI